MWPFRKKRERSIRTKRDWGGIFKRTDVFMSGILVAKMEKRDAHWDLHIHEGSSRWSKVRLSFIDRSSALDYLEGKFDDLVLEEVQCIHAEKLREAARIVAEEKLAEDEKKKFIRKERKLEVDD